MKINLFQEKMCPLWPAHYFLMYILILFPLWFLSFRVMGAAAQATSEWKVQFEPNELDGSNKIFMDKNGTTVHMSYNKSELIEQNAGNVVLLELLVDDRNLLEISPAAIILNTSYPDTINDTISFEVKGKLLGRTELKAKKTNVQTEASWISNPLKITVVRVTGAIDKAFTYSVASLVGIIFINMGAALDTKILIDTIKRPIGPAIGFLSQFMIMPLLAYGIAKILIPLPAMQLGLFVTGISPGGGASNIWTLTLGGNLDLSITMTTISTFASFAMMPLWLFTLGSNIFSEAKLTVPYSKIVTFALSLVVPLAIGITIKRFLPKTAKFLVRILKPFAVFLIVFIVVFAIYTNLYLFQLFTWEILISGFLLPTFGYLLGGGTAILMKQSWRDIIAIAIETGVQNTGLAIFALRFSLPQPEADITTALPVAVAIMTPIFPIVLMCCQKFFCQNLPKDEKKEQLTEFLREHRENKNGNVENGNLRLNLKEGTDKNSNNNKTLTSLTEDETR